MADKNLLENNLQHNITILKNNSNNNNNNNVNINNNNNNYDQEQLKNQVNNVKKSDENEEPPDGGTRAWCIMFSAFFCNSVLFGIINTYGVVYLNLQKRLILENDAEASSKAALVGSLTIGTTFLLSPVSGILIDKIGLRKTTFIGGCFATSGLLLSSAFNSSITVLYLTYGIMFGLGAALTYTPTLAILGHYFKRYLGIVSGFVTSGSSIFTIILPGVLNYLLTHYELSGTLAVLGAATFFIIICALIYKPLQAPPPPSVKRKPGESSVAVCIKSLVHVDNWKRKKYVIWALSIPIALIGYFVPYVHMGKLVEDTFPDSNKNLPVMCIGITSGLGRLLFGYIADLKGVNRILLQQISFFIIGLLTMVIPLTKSYILLLIISLGVGLVDGCFITLLGPIAFDICGPRGATQAIGFLLGLCSIPLTIGPPIAGMLYDQTKSYTLSFVLAGIPPIIGGSLMFLIKFIKDDNVEASLSAVGDDPSNEQALNKYGGWNSEATENEVKLLNGSGGGANNPIRITLRSPATDATQNSTIEFENSKTPNITEENAATQTLLNKNVNNYDSAGDVHDHRVSSESINTKHTSTTKQVQQQQQQQQQQDLPDADPAIKDDI